MYFQIVYNNGKDRFIRTKSKKEGADMEQRLKKISLQGKIRRFFKLNFDVVTPDQILKTE